MKRLLKCLFIFHLTACLGVENNKSQCVLLFTIHQERDVYQRTDYGEPPQFAIWLENQETGEILTVFVTYRTAKGDFEGKAECPVSLPAWIGAFRKQTGRADIPSFNKPAPDAITGATPKAKEFLAEISVPKSSRWYYFIEMNVSGDYNPAFPRITSDGRLDSQGNGQPSIIYRGEIAGIPGEKSTPQLIGRTEQMYLSTEVNADLKGITNARDVFSKIKVTCNPQSTQKLGATEEI